MRKRKVSISAVICMVLLCAMIAGCVAAGSTGTQTNPPATTLTTVPTTPPTTSPSTTGGTQPTDPEPTQPAQPEVADCYTVTVRKKDQTYGYYDETLALVYNEKGQLLEYQAGYRKLLYTYDEDGNMSCRKMYNSAGEQMEQIDYTYDAQGRLVQTKGFGYAEVYTTYKTEYIYDENGNLIHKKDYQNGELFTEEVYDAAGNLLEGFSYMGGGYDSHSVYTYGEAGNLLSVETERGGEAYSGWYYFYDKDGRLVREERFLMSRGERKELTNTYTYDENGRCIRYDMGGFQGEQSYETYTYDAAGNMLSSEYHHYQESGSTGYYWTYDEEGRITSWKSTNRQGTTTYTWEYDEQGNVGKFAQDTMTYSFSYTWPEAQLPQAAWEEIFHRIAAFTGLSVYDPETYARIYD